MSSTNPGHARVSLHGASTSGPTARVSREALAHNARRAYVSGVRAYSPSLLSADAWGHGAPMVAEVLAAAAILPSEEGVHVLDPYSLFGLPGGDAACTPALHLHGTVLSTKRLRSGEGVSYGYLYRATSDTHIALVTGGYAQGVIRSLGGSIGVRIGTDIHPVVGRVAMDVCVVDVGDAGVARGDRAVFFGDPYVGDPSLTQWSRASGLRVNEIVTMVGLRASRELSL
ncbi:alanine racemase C-terminal domain-containing protein [Microbacterium sp. NPDC076911]|uniref:alanine racemase C-terminal domain-containing protein n=1 Tax=Microbacterium sp. NPDC076911 TaxID=3154958 RepID=UPI00343E90E8